MLEIAQIWISRGEIVSLNLLKHQTIKVISQQAYEYSSNKIYAGLYVFNLCNEIGYKEAYF